MLLLLLRVVPTLSLTSCLDDFSLSFTIVVLVFVLLLFVELSIGTTAFPTDITSSDGDDAALVRTMLFFNFKSIFWNGISEGG